MLDCEDQSLKIKKYELTLQMEPTRFEDLEELKVYSTQLLQMYTASKEWNEYVDNLMGMQFQEIQTKEI